jgi:hypothetical protein
LRMNALHRADLVRCPDERQIGHQWGFIDQLPLPPAEPVGTMATAKWAESSVLEAVASWFRLAVGRQQWRLYGAGSGHLKIGFSKAGRPGPPHAGAARGRRVSTPSRTRPDGYHEELLVNRPVMLPQPWFAPFGRITSDVEAPPVVCRSQIGRDAIRRGDGPPPPPLPRRDRVDRLPAAGNAREVMLELWPVS